LIGERREARAKGNEIEPAAGSAPGESAAP
jgi:hypothetical protein